MTAQIFTLQERRAIWFVQSVRTICVNQDAKKWKWFFGAIGAFRPRPLLTDSGSGPAPPYTQVSYYTSPARGWRDFEADQVPPPDDPRIDWILRQFVLETAECVFHGRDTRLYYAFSEHLRDEKVIQGADEQAQWQVFLDKIFFSQAPAPAELRFLDLEGYRAYLAPAEVQELVELEARVGLLRNAAARLDQKAPVTFLAAELRRLNAFMNYAGADKAALFYTEAGT
jgi:hypothetical protein